MSKISQKTRKPGPIYEVIDSPFFWRNVYILQDVLDSYKNIPNQPQFLPSDVKIVLKRNDYGKNGYMHKWSWSVKSIWIIVRKSKRKII